MSWIQENRFAAGLGGFTAVAAAGLLFWGLSERSKYAKAQEDYQSASDQIAAMEKAPLYPNEDNKRQKSAAVADYETAVTKLQKGFDAYRSADLPQVDPAAFTEDVQKAKREIDDALSANKVEADPKFFLGFEIYTRDAAKKAATGVLGYELQAATELFKELAAAKPSKIVNVSRPQLDEETGKAWDATGKTARALPIEITFNGNEASLRSFLSALDDSKKYYYVVRTMKVTNTTQKAPGSADAAFEKPGEAASGGESGGDGGFVLPGDSSTPAPATPAAPAAPAADSGQILQQVLGNEKINVFLRIDIMQFLPGKEQPKP